jgi:hypothetical protein
MHADEQARVLTRSEWILRYEHRPGLYRQADVATRRAEPNAAGATLWDGAF